MEWALGRVLLLKTKRESLKEYGTTTRPGKEMHVDLGRVLALIHWKEFREFLL
jgi:hypothetical protein